jgi:hypothetical protein
VAGAGKLLYPYSTQSAVLYSKTRAQGRFGLASGAFSGLGPLLYGLQAVRYHGQARWTQERKRNEEKGEGAGELARLLVVRQQELGRNDACEEGEEREAAGCARWWNGAR